MSGYKRIDLPVLSGITEEDLSSSGRLLPFLFLSHLNGIEFQFWPERGQPRQTSLEIRKMLYKTAVIFERSHSESGDIFGEQHMLMKNLVINFENLNFSFRLRSIKLKAFLFILIYLYFCSNNDTPCTELTLFSFRTRNQ